MDPQVTTAIVATLGILGTIIGAVIADRSVKAAASAETERLRIQLQDAERANRQGTYHRLIAQVLKITDLRTRGEPVGDAFDELYWLVGGVMLFAPSNVKEKVRAVVTAITNENEIGPATQAMIVEMHSDVTEGILSVDPSATPPR